MISIVKLCPMCRKQSARTLDTNQKQYQKWLDGVLIQEAMPQLSTDDREYVITGFCDSCMDSVFSTPEEAE